MLPAQGPFFLLYSRASIGVQALMLHTAPQLISLVLIKFCIAPLHKLCQKSNTYRMLSVRYIPDYQKGYMLDEYG